MTRRHALGTLVLGGLVVLGSGVRPGDGIVDRRFLAMPPAYPAPPRGFLPLPSAGTSPVFVAPGTPADRPVWSPARTDPVFGVDGQGHVTSALQYTPGRFVIPDGTER